jgi:hypothetical protein
MKMHAPLFFAMLKHGRILERRRNYAKFYEMTRVAAYSTYQKQSQEEYQQFLWDSSLSPRDREDREEFRRQIEKESKASQVYLPSSAALDFFRGSIRGAH